MDKKTYLAQSKYPLFRLLSYMKDYKKDYILAIIYSSLNKLFDILPEILLGFAVNLVVSRENSWIYQLTGVENLLSQLFIIGFVTFFIWVFESIFQYLYNLKWRNLAQNIEHKLRVEVYNHIQKSKLEEIEKVSTGQLISTINDDVNQMERFLEDGINQILQIFVSTLLIGIVFLFASPLITLLAIAPIPLIIFGAFYFQHKLASKFLNVRQKASEISSVLQKNLLGIFTIKSFTSEEFEKNKVKKTSSSYQKANKETIKISSMVTPIIRIFVLTGFLCTMLVGGYLTINNSMDVGVFSILIFLSQRLLWPFNNLAEVTVNYQRVMASTTRVFDLLLFKTEKFNEGENIKDKDLGIRFNNINFSYEKNSKIILDNLNINIEKNTSVAFVGESGSGKSTIIKLLCRFYDLQKNQGEILFNDKNINSFNLESLRKNISLVSQDIFLFDGTIIENIAYGAKKYNENEIIEASKVAGIHNFIMSLPEKYNTNIGQRGNLLSGGQKQRISIARAIFKNSKVLILDEATSAVDNETEFEIQKSLNKIANSKTIIMVAHRLSTIRNCNIIFVLEQGKIIEKGNHQELLKLNKTYARLWKIQTGKIIS